MVEDDEVDIVFCECIDVDEDFMDDEFEMEDDEVIIDFVGV